MRPWTRGASAIAAIALLFFGHPATAGRHRPVSPDGRLQLAVPDVLQQARHEFLRAGLAHGEGEALVEGLANHGLAGFHRLHARAVRDRA
jgi:hypothetical protein